MTKINTVLNVMFYTHRSGCLICILFTMNSWSFSLHVLY